MNVFAGINGAGKSTVIQSLLALRQSARSGSLAEGSVQLRGDLVDLGTAREVYCAEPNSDSIDLSFGRAARPAIELRCPQSKETSSEYFLRLASAVAPDDANSLFQEPFNYLHAERIGPRKVFQIPDGGAQPLWVGKYGENAPYIITSHHRETNIDNNFLVLESSDGKEYPTLQYQWPLWMARLFPGFDGESEIYGEVDQVRLGLALQTQQTGRKLYVRPTNTGFGLSFAQGMVVAGLVAKPGTILVAENPEAHLHPKAQSNLGEFLARVSAGGSQVFVETHSEHVLNGIRRMIKQTVLSPDKVRIFFFAKSAIQFEPTVSRIPVTESGDLSDWPEGFFDQLDKDLTAIFT